MKKLFLLIVLVFTIVLLPRYVFSKVVPKDQKQAIDANFLLTTKEKESDPQNKDRGIGPVKNVVLVPINKKMVDEGKSIYNNKCIVCHDFDQKKIGPPLRNITKDRTPEYIMNLLINSVQMQKENATVKDLLKKYNNVLMPDPEINQAQARSVLEYLRSVAK